MLCAVRLLDALPEALHHTITCVGFAVPPVRDRGSCMRRLLTLFC